MVDAWEDLVERMKGESGHMYSNRYAILWADAEIAALRGEVDADNQIIETLEMHKKMLQEREEKLEAALARYREAVEWACRCQDPRVIVTDDQGVMVNFRDELRRRVGEG